MKGVSEHVFVPLRDQKIVKSVKAANGTMVERRNILNTGCLMAMLDRYRKPGGFLQLLNLIETSGPQKQSKFLEIVREEDPRWADMISDKLLSIQKICSWNTEQLMEVVANLQILSLAVMLHGLEEAMRDRFTSAMSNSQRRTVLEQFNASQPTAAEISTTFAKVITDVRKMISDGRLRIDNLSVEEGIEETVLRKGAKPEQKESPPAPAPEVHSAYPELNMASGTTSSGSLNISSNVAATGELILLKKKLAVISQENQNLKQEVGRLRGKLDQIRKIA